MRMGAFLVNCVAYRLSLSLMRSNASPPPLCKAIGVGLSRRGSEELLRSGAWMTSAPGMVFAHGAADGVTAGTDDPERRLRPLGLSGSSIGITPIG